MILLWGAGSSSLEIYGVFFYEDRGEIIDLSELDGEVYVVHYKDFGGESE